MIPQAFLARMRTYPDLDCAALEAALEKPPVRGLRVNARKTAVRTLAPLLPFSLVPLSFAADGFSVAAAENDAAFSAKVGGLAAHHAGMFYMQDPSAMCAAAAAPPARGARVLDLCAAPGGKTAQLSAAVGDTGTLVSNEIVPARCRVLLGNVERLGLANTVVTNLSPAALADFYGAYFDLVLADVPCSGEGMFRKYETAGAEWSPDVVAMCAARGRDILEQAARCVAPGGRLIYSTCTFSIEENEANVASFLAAHPDFSLLPAAPAVAAVTANGIVPAGAPAALALCRRFYPHLAAGEGQFVAVLTRSGDVPAARPKDAAVPLKPSEIAPVSALFEKTLSAPPAGRLVALRESVFAVPDVPLPPRGVFAAGVCLGTRQKDRVEPHHHLFSAYGGAFLRQLRLFAGDPRVAAYLAGEEIDCPELAGENGFAAVLYEGAPIGGGKAVNGRLKNDYPKGLRSR